MDLWTAILTCSLYTRDEALVRAIAQSTSEGDALAVVEAVPTLNALRGAPATLEEAVARVDGSMARGGRPRMGWMQISPEWAAAFGRPVREAFDPCVNVSIGTALLSAFDDECGVDDSSGSARREKSERGGGGVERARRRCVIQKYGQALGIQDFEEVTSLELRFQRPAEASGSGDAPIFVSMPNGRVWGSDCIFFATANGVQPADAVRGGSVAGTRWAPRGDP